MWTIGTTVHMLNASVIVGLTQSVVKKIDATHFVSRVSVNRGQLAESKNKKSNYSITCHNKGTALN